MSHALSTDTEIHRPHEEELAEISGALQTKLETLERFIARRFDELSMEINATSQQMDMAESGFTAKFGEILQVINAISYNGGGLTPANTGVELGAVVDITENAANHILDAAGRITAITEQSGLDWDSATIREEAIEAINRNVEEIILACSFQDITGQRIRTALDNLKTAEDRLSGVLDGLGIKITGEGEENPLVNDSDVASQADIDALFADD